jgi:hypothetical protein
MQAAAPTRTHPGTRTQSPALLARSLTQLGLGNIEVIIINLVR